MEILDHAENKEKKSRSADKIGESTTTIPSGNVVCVTQFKKQKEVREAQAWLIERAKLLDW